MQPIWYLGQGSRCKISMTAICFVDLIWIVLKVFYYIWINVLCLSVMLLLWEFCARCTQRFSLHGLAARNVPILFLTLILYILWVNTGSGNIRVFLFLKVCDLFFRTVCGHECWFYRLCIICGHNCFVISFKGWYMVSCI